MENNFRFFLLWLVWTAIFYYFMPEWISDYMIKELTIPFYHFGCPKKDYCGMIYLFFELLLVVLSVLYWFSKDTGDWSKIRHLPNAKGSRKFLVKYYIFRILTLSLLFISNQQSFLEKLEVSGKQSFLEKLEVSEKQSFLEMIYIPLSLPILAYIILT